MNDWAEWVWLNGRMVCGTEAAVPVFDRGFLLGDGLFETLRAVGGRLFRAERHLARLRHGAARLQLPLPAEADELMQALYETLRVNHLREAALRLTVTRGSGRGGLGIEGAGPSVGVITARPFSGYPEHWYNPGACAIVSRVIKNEHSPLCGLKTTSWLDHVLARAEATERGADEALLQNTRGDVVEGSGTNLFIVVAGGLQTPDLGSGCLPGITREAVIELAREPGLEMREAPLSPAALLAANEAFLTNSLQGVAPLVRLDGQPIGSGHSGPVTQMLADRLRERVMNESR